MEAGEEEGEEAERQEALDSRQASGLAWMSVGSVRPAEGQELTHAELAEALQSRAEAGADVAFEESEWNTFGIAYLRMGHFVEAAGQFFKPTALLEKRIFKVPDPVLCTTPEEVRSAAVEFGFPVQMKIKDSIELVRGGRSHGGLSAVRIVEREEEALSVATVMLKNHELLRAMQRARRLTTMERECTHIRSNIEKVGRDPYADKTQIASLKAKLSQTQHDIAALKEQSRETPTQVIVMPSSRAANSIADYTGQPLWDPDLQTELMECDRSLAVLRASYVGDMSILSQLGISKELFDEHQGAAGRQKRPQMIQEEIDFKQNILDQMNQVDTDDVEHLRKAKEITEELTNLSSELVTASARAEESRIFMQQLRERLRESASQNPPPEPDAHSSRHVVGEAEELDKTGLDHLTMGQQRVELEKRKRAIRDRRDARLHPKCKPLTEQINAANNAQAKYVALLAGAACEDKPCFARLIDTGAIFLTAQRLEETTHKRQELTQLKAHQRKFAAEIESMDEKLNVFSDLIASGEANLTALRQEINALPNSDQTQRIRLNKKLNAQQRELRETRMMKVNIQRDLDSVYAEKAKQAEVLPIVQAALDILEAGLGDGAWNTPLHRACQMNYDWHVKSMLEAGALADAADINGDTPLHMAVAFGHHECIKHFTQVLDVESLTRALATHNMYGQRPIDLAQDPMCRIELRKAILKVERSIETPFMRIGLAKLSQEEQEAKAFSRTSSAGQFSRAQSAQTRGDTFHRELSGGDASIGPASGPRWESLDMEEKDLRQDVGDIVYNAELERPKRSFPTTWTPYVGPPYAHMVQVDNVLAQEDADEEHPGNRAGGQDSAGPDTCKQ